MRDQSSMSTCASATQMSSRTERRTWVDRQKSFGWKAQLADILKEHSRYREGHKKGDMRRKASYATQHNVGNGLYRLFRQLHELGYPLNNPRNLESKHLRVLWEWMEGCYETGDLSSSTIQGYVSYLRKFTGWIGKPDLIVRAGVQFKNPECATRSQNTDHDKSWEAAGLDIGQLIDQALDVAPWVAVALLAQAAFGLRRKEALCLRPAADYGGNGLLNISRGTKGGRYRVVPIYTQWQYDVLAFLIAYCRRYGRGEGHIGDPERTLERNLRHYSYVLGRRLGITKDLVGATGHGLRAGFACRTLEAFGIRPPVRGGDVQAADPMTVALAYHHTTEALGHSRRHVAGAYVGAQRSRGDEPHPDGIDMQRIVPPKIDGLVSRMTHYLDEGRLDRAAISRFRASEQEK